MGFKVLLGRTARSISPSGYSSAPPVERADDVNRMFANPDVDALLTTIGGYASIHILEHLDLGLIASNPKFLIGFSDTTLLQAALWHSIGLRSLAGPALLPQFGEYGGMDPFTERSFRRAAEGVDALGSVEPSGTVISEIHRWDVDDDCPRTKQAAPLPRILNAGSADGWLAPVNLESLLALAGTEWFPDLTGAILLLEAAEVTPMARFHQGLCQLRSMGVLARVNALLIGRFDRRSGATDELLRACIAEVLPERRIPVLSELDHGHTDPMHTLPWGVHTELKAEEDSPKLEVSEPVGRSQ